MEKSKDNLLWSNEYNSSLFSMNDELIVRLKDRLPSTYTMTENTESVCKFYSSTPFWPVRIWITEIVNKSTRKCR